MEIRHNLLVKAKIAKNDEFYTQPDVIKTELLHYLEPVNLFENKTILCNCNDFYKSNFIKVLFTLHPILKWRKLIGIEYNKDKAHKLEIDNETISFDVTELKGDGDFRSAESIEYLKQADIVITNPPFSLFREYVAQLMEYRKQFLIMGNNNAITFKEIFPLIKENKLWLGANSNKTYEFRLGDKYEKYNRIDGKGHKYGNVLAISWFTNLPLPKRNYKLIPNLHNKYAGFEYRYPKYDNYNAINIDKTDNIPNDYYGIMGVPITFLDKYNSDEFEIIALGNNRKNFTPTKLYNHPIQHRSDGTVTNADKVNYILTIEIKHPPAKGVYYTSDNSKYLIAPYARILIRRKDKEIKNDTK